MQSKRGSHHQAHRPRPGPHGLGGARGPTAASERRTETCSGVAPQYDAVHQPQESSARAIDRRQRNKPSSPSQFSRQSLRRGRLLPRRRSLAVASTQGSRRGQVRNQGLGTAVARGQRLAGGYESAGHTALRGHGVGDACGHVDGDGRAQRRSRGLPARHRAQDGGSVDRTLARTAVSKLGMS
jgi:hypothetical protein